MIYNIGVIESEVEIFNNIQGDLSDFMLCKASRGDYVVAWLAYGVFFGKVGNGSIEFFNNEKPDYEKYLVKLRVFNKNRELLIWRSGEIFKGRLRTDGEGKDKVEFIDADQILLGTKSEDCNNSEFSRVTDGKGTNFIMPFPSLNLTDKKRLVLTTRNYLDSNAIGQTGIIDSRFVIISMKEF